MEFQQDYPEIKHRFCVNKRTLFVRCTWSTCSFSRIAQKIKNYSSFNFLPENLEKCRSTELYGAALEGSTIFSLSQLFGLYVNGKLSIS